MHTAAEYIFSPTRKFEGKSPHVLIIPPSCCCWPVATVDVAGLPKEKACGAEPKGPTAGVCCCWIVATLDFAGLPKEKGCAEPNGPAAGVCG